MTGRFRFGPAAPGEDVVYGASEPGTSPPGAVDDWLATVRDAGVERAVVLLPDEQLAPYDDLLGRYRAAFGDDRVLHAPVPDHHLADEATLVDDVLPFLRVADGAGEAAVVHCRAGLGRTGHVLAAWLVHARDYDPRTAVDAVAGTGRSPREAVLAGNAAEGDLEALLLAVA